MDIAAHPFADLFPMLSDVDAAALQADIAANGLRDRIVILDGKILDGRNRYRAAVGAGVVPKGLPPEGSALWISHFRRFVPVQDGDALAWVLSKNLHRRHLSESQRAMVAAKLEGFGHGGTRLDFEEQDANLHLGRKGAADILHVSTRSVASAAKVRERGAPELIEAVERGDIAVSVAETAAKTMSVADQIRALQETNPRAFAGVVREQRKLRQDEKKERRQEKETALAGRVAALPEKKFCVILADPEWRFETFSAETGMDRSADNHYPTSPLELIKSRPVSDIAHEHAALLLWATVPMLPQALEVMSAWGFAYKSHAVWTKDAMGTGFWFRNQHELLLLGTRGDIPAPAMGDQFRSVQAHPVGEHSAKPSFAHDLAEAYWPYLPKIELNARTRRPGWEAWGLEAPEAVHAASESIAMSFEAATPILLKHYAEKSGDELAALIGRPVGTVRTWAHRLGLTSAARLKTNAAHLGDHLKRKEGA